MPTLLEGLTAHVSTLVFPEGTTASVTQRSCRVHGEHIGLKVERDGETHEFDLTTPPYYEGELESLCEQLTVEQIVAACDSPDDAEQAGGSMTVVMIIGGSSMNLTDILIETMPEGVRQRMLAREDLPADLRERLTRKQ